MSDELEEAVKRVRKCQAEGPDAAYPNAKAAGAFHEDCLTITDAYLAESAENARLRAEIASHAEVVASVRSTFAATGAENARLRAENEELQTWKGEQQQALIKMSIACLNAGFNGDSVVDGVKWVCAENERLRAAIAAEDAAHAWVQDGPFVGECEAIGPHHGDRCNGGRIQSPNAQFTRDCLVCKGTGLATPLAMLPI